MKSINNKSKIAILMATYNAGEYLRNQVDSIINQTYNNWTLYIRDDGSSDNTIQIIHEYVCKHTNIIFVTDSEKHLGAQGSFLRLLSIVESDYYMFSDQDDIWLPSKIEVSINAIADNSSNLPTIVHTNSTLVDKDLKVITPNYWKDINLHPDSLKSYNFIAISNYCQGATMLFNKKAKEVSVPIIGKPRMHDWWVSTRTLKNKGKIISIYEPQILYRQHGNNVLGVRSGKSFRITNRLSSLNQIIKDNLEVYQTLRDDKYGSCFKYLYYKIRYLIHMHGFIKH